MNPLIATFSIVGCDLSNGDVGVAVASKFLAVGSVVPWAQAGAGAVATQSYANMSFGPDGLALLSQGLDAQACLDQLLAADAGREQRQVGVVDMRGGAATWTGSQCHAWAGGVTGRGFAAQGNILTGPGVVPTMAAAFEATSGELAERLLAALAAGDKEGGDSRGRQSAALYVARAGGAYGGVLDRYIDLRVDDHGAPVAELGRLLSLHRFYLTPPRPEDLMPIDSEIARELQEILQSVGYYAGPINGVYDDATHAALESYGGVENLEERLVAKDKIDPLVLDFLRAKSR
ncbi:MAG TPA: DUF1028 domain-containing protein [Herpetosiphonaceae bacterium]|nr:DUF1028 domain-containing protein [Herpetosiphonaceae bacterium]